MFYKRIFRPLTTLTLYNKGEQISLFLSRGIEKYALQAKVEAENFFQILLI